jgi:hypothetical protein
MALIKLEVLSIARTQRLNRTTADYFYLNRNLCTELNICVKIHLNFFMDGTLFPFKNAPPKTVLRKMLHLLLISPVLKKGAKFTVVTCCSANNAFIRPFVIVRETYKQNLPIGFAVLITDSGYMNDSILLQRFQSFQLHWFPGNC